MMVSQKSSKKQKKNIFVNENDATESEINIDYSQLKKQKRKQEKLEVS